MKQNTAHKPTANNFSLLRQLCNFIPPNLLPQLARQTGVEDQALASPSQSDMICRLPHRFTDTTLQNVDVIFKNRGQVGGNIGNADATRLQYDINHIHRTNVSCTTT